MYMHIQIATLISQSFAAAELRTGPKGDCPPMFRESPLRISIRSVIPGLKMKLGQRFLCEAGDFYYLSPAAFLF